jgi:mono/diheme cytochrome c family protein
MKLRTGEWIVVGGSALIALFAALTGSLIYLKPPPVEYAYAESAATQQGEAIYRREGCGSCHQVFGNGATYGPSLDGEGSRRTPAWLQAYLLDPRPGVGIKPYRVKMPSYGNLKAEERDALVAYLQALRTPDPTSPLAQRAER